MGGAAITDMDGFELGAPSLVCRWRLSNCRLPLENRHLRALLARDVNGSRVPTELMAWAKQHIEWTLEQGASEHPNGTLMLIVDGQGRAAMTVGPFVPLADASLAGLMRRADRARGEAERSHVAPETLWVVRRNVLTWDPGERCAPSGAASLIGQLAQTLGLDVRAHDGLTDAIVAGSLPFDEAFLVSDEHGVVPAIDARGPHGVRFAQGYQRLLDRG